MGQGRKLLCKVKEGSRQAKKVGRRVCGHSTQRGGPQNEEEGAEQNGPARRHAAQGGRAPAQPPVGGCRGAPRAVAGKAHRERGPAGRLGLLQAALLAEVLQGGAYGVLASKEKILDRDLGVPHTEAGKILIVVSSV